MRQLNHKHEVHEFQDAKMHEEISGVLTEFISQKIDKQKKDERVREIFDRYKHRPEIQTWANSLVEAALSIQ